MAARTTSKPKQSGGTRPAARRAAAKDPANKAVAAKKPAARQTAAKKAPARKASQKQAKSKSGRKTPAVKALMAGGDTATEMLIEQNEALRAELEQAQERIKHLEELNRNVVNRIDWVIDSLQGVLKR